MVSLAFLNILLQVDINTIYSVVLGICQEYYSACTLVEVFHAVDY